jgi:TPR repeat protein
MGRKAKLRSDTELHGRDAMRRLIRAASNGDAHAQFNLGVLYDSRLDDNGRAIGGNRAEAIRWLLKAAHQSLPRAQVKLAELYAGGPGRSASHAEACFWFLLARASLSGMHRERASVGYERSAAELTPAQISKVMRRVRLWTPTKWPDSPGDLPAESQKRRIRQ